MYGPLREGRPALVVHLVVVAVALDARRRRIQLDGGDVVRGLLEVVQRRTRPSSGSVWYSELQLLAALDAIHVVERVQDRERRVVGVALAGPADVAIGADRLERKRVAEIEREIQRRAPVLELARQRRRAVVVIGPALLQIVGAAIVRESFGTG